MAILRLILALLVGSTIVPVAVAQHTWQVSGSGAESEGYAEVDTASVAAVHYFDAVDENRGPLALAAFLDPSTHFSVAVSRSDASRDIVPNAGGFLLIGGQSRVDEYSVGGRYVLWPSRWYAGGSYSRGASDPIGAPVRDTERDAHALVAGKYFGEATTLELHVARSKVDSTSSVIFCTVECATRVARLEALTDVVRLEAMHLRQAARLPYALFGGVVETRFDVEIETIGPPIVVGPPGPNPPFPLPPFPLPPNPPPRPASPVFPGWEAVRAYDVGAALYPTARVGVRLGYVRFDGDSSTDDGYEVGVSWFFRRNVGLSFAASRQRPGNFGVTRKGAVFSVIGRL